MLELGKIQKLKVVKKVDFGCYLADPEEGSPNAIHASNAGSGRETSGRDGKDAEKTADPVQGGAAEADSAVTTGAGVSSSGGNTVIYIVIAAVAVIAVIAVICAVMKSRKKKG